MTTKPLAEPKPLHVGVLEIENVKRIRFFAVALDDGEPLILTGDNGAGKSSVFDGLCMALTGTGLDQPIRTGAGRAVMKVTLTSGAEVEYLIERRISQKSRTLVVTLKDGTPIQRPQEFLDSLMGSLAFDPLEFVRLKPKQQADAIRTLTGLDTTAIDRAYATTFAERTVVNRRFKDLTALAKDLERPVVPEKIELPEIPEPATAEVEVSASELTAKLQVMNELVAEHQKLADSAHSLSDEVDIAKGEVERLRDLLTNAEAKLARVTAHYHEAEQVAADKLKEAPRPTIDQIMKLKGEIASIDATNAAIRTRREAAASSYREKCRERENALLANANARDAATRNAKDYEAKIAELKAVENEVEALNKKLEGYEEQKLEMARTVKMPVEGMTFDDTGVMIGGIPFAQLSMGDQIKTSAQVAMASNPKLKLILIREGALVNTANLKIILEAAKDRGYQVFLEKFAEQAGDVGLHIVDGEVTSIDGQPVESEEPTAKPEAGDPDLKLV